MGGYWDTVKVRELERLIGRRCLLEKFGDDKVAPGISVGEHLALRDYYIELSNECIRSRP